MENKFSGKNIFKFVNLRIILILVVSFIITFGIFLTTLINKQYSYKVGDLVRADIVANKDGPDAYATNSKRAAAMQQVEPVINTRDYGVTSRLSDQLNNLFTKTINLIDSKESKEKKIKELQDVSTLTLGDRESYLTLLSMTKEDLQDLNNKINPIFRDAINMDIRDFVINVKDPTDAKFAEEPYSIEPSTDQRSVIENYDSTITKYGFSLESEKLAKDIGDNNILPNKIIDKDATRAALKKANESVDTVLIKQGQIIINGGTILSQGQYSTMQELGMLQGEQSFSSYALKVGSIALWILLYYLLLVIYIGKHKEDFLKKPKVLMFICIIITLVLVLVRAGGMISQFLLPLALSSMILNIFFRRKDAFFISLLGIILVGPLVSFNTIIIILLIMSDILCYLLINDDENRNQIVYASGAIGAFNALIIFSHEIILNNNTIGVVQKILMASIGVIASSIVAIGSLPILESAFNFVSSIKLMELCNLNQPLLKRLLLEANGTYHHCMMVADLAEAAAEDIGANSLLVRAGSFYHDIGKMENPYFFKENQVGEYENPHDKMSTKASAFIITSHVEDGIKLAKKYSLPPEVIDFIIEHHGLSLVKYFYILEKNNAKDGEMIDESSYRYKGRLPVSKESGIVSLADAVEASVRSINDPTIEKIEDMVNKIVRSKIDDGQLNNCKLSLREIGIVKKSFLTSLKGIYHKRISYPKDKVEIEKIVSENIKSKMIELEKEDVQKKEKLELIIGEK